MKSLAEYMLESLSLKGKSQKATYYKIDGRLWWDFHSEESGIKSDEVEVAGWFGGVINDDKGEPEIVAFWSDKSPWIFYVYISEVKSGKTNWAAVSSDDNSIKNPQQFATIVLDNFEKYCQEHATVPEFDSITVPGPIKKFLNEVVK